jgi:hypothetical protein
MEIQTSQLGRENKKFMLGFPLLLRSVGKEASSTSPSLLRLGKSGRTGAHDSAPIMSEARGMPAAEASLAGKVGPGFGGYLILSECSVVS